jgi:PAS domain S-box-containing protein
MVPPAAQDDRALRAIVEGVEATTGEEFFRSLVRHLAAALDVDYAFVSEFTADRQAFRTVALWGRGAIMPNAVSPLVGTPCEAVLSGQMAHHADRLQQLFPDDKVLADWGVQSYCGVPIFDVSGAVAGHLAILDRKPMHDGPRGLSVMRIFAARVRAELVRLRMEAALRESEARYRDLYEGAPAAYMSFGTDGRLITWNKRAEELTGFGPEELRGRHFLELGADSAGGKPHQQALNEQFLAGTETVSEVEGRRKDGSLFWVRTHVRPLRDARGDVFATQSVLVDITDRKRAEEALRASEERLARILASAMDAIVTFDDRGRIELFNAAAEQVFACRAADAIGQPVDHFLSDDFRRAVAGAIRDGKPYVWAPDGLAARRADGTEFAAEATISRVEVGGRQLHTLILRDVAERKRAEEELLYLQEEIKSVHNFEEIVGQSPALRAVLKKIELVAGTDSSVLIYGETGTGKELIARAVHSNSGRKDRPLIKVNCAALPAGLIESELFGHEKGAFTGALERRIGRFELAHGGTLFLDEIGELSPEVQVKLLRVLQEREFERIGGSATIKVDVRVIAATNRDLAKGVADGTFRQDLYYRLNVFPVVLPPLRERPDDVPLLVHYFVARYAPKIGRRITHVPEDALQRLAAYAWPGNVRELENVVERAVILSAGPELEIAPEVLPAAAAAAPARATAGTLDDVERSHIIAILKRTNWRIDGPQGAARILNLNPSTLRSRMQKLGIRRSADEGA